MDYTELRKAEPAGFLLVVAGWCFALVFSAALIVISAPPGDTLDPFLPFLFPAVWLVSLALVSVGVFRLTHHLDSMLLRAILTIIAVSAQCFAYVAILFYMFFPLFFWAGGQC